MAEKYCPKLHGGQLNEYNYCWKCGEKLTEVNPIKCSECGRGLPEHHEYCTYCGNKVK